MLDSYFNRCVNLPVLILRPMLLHSILSFVLNIRPSRLESSTTMLLLVSLQGLFQIYRALRYQS